MGDAPDGYRWPYDRSPGGSMPSPHTDPAEGRSDLAMFTLLSLLSTAIIGVVGMAAWFIVH